MKKIEENVPMDLGEQEKNAKFANVLELPNWPARLFSKVNKMTKLKKTWNFFTFVVLTKSGSEIKLSTVHIFRRKLKQVMILVHDNIPGLNLYT